MTLAPPGDGSLPTRRAGARLAGRVAIERPGETPRDVLDRLGLATEDARPVIVVSGGADDLREPFLSAARKVIGPGLREAVAGTETVIVDGGTAAGVMALVGDERADDPAGMPVLLGVAPAGLVDHDAGSGAAGTALDPNHTHFALADSDEWGGETPLLAAIAAELARDESVAMVLVGGGAGALAEVEEAVARRWPVFVVERSGGLADDIAAASRGDAAGEELRGTLEGADVRPVATADALASQLRDELDSRDSRLLKDAWGRFATFDALAVSLRRAFERFQIATLVLGVVATALALVYDSLGDSGPEALRWLVIAVPITVSVLVALANRRGAGKRWVLLRAAAEAVKSEIYRYRTQTGVYSDAALGLCAEPTDRPQRLAGRLTDIETGLMHTAASSGRLTPYTGPLPPAMYGEEEHDDGLRPLDAHSYVAMRVGGQLAYYGGKVETLDRLRARLQLLTLVAGGAGTLLAALGFEIWIGLTTAMAGGALAHLGYLQVDSTLVAYNRAAAQLAALRREFDAGGAQRPDIESLVTRGEKILTTEQSGWVQQMTDALEQLQDEQAKAAEKTEQDRDAETPDR
jgi:SLOG in TRPM, prokaryote/SMODS and SLOG-associating 2TM effector domain 1/Protein of unknown function (DUF4231)